MRRFGPWLLLMLLALLPTPSLAQQSAVVLVANSGVQSAPLNRDAARAMFAMRQRTWPNGQVLRIFVLPNDDPVHERFAKESLAVYPHQLQLSWDRVVFSGTGQAPTRVSSQAEMLERIADTPGGLGYLEREYLDDRVQVIPMD